MMKRLARVRYRRSIGYGWREAFRAFFVEYPRPEARARTEGNET